MEPLDAQLDFDSSNNGPFNPAAPPKYWLGHSFRNYANFNGRATRIEYWNYMFYNVTFLWAALGIDFMTGMTFGETAMGPVYLITLLGLFIPTLAVTVRRLHDTGRPGGWIFIGLVPIVGPFWHLWLMLQKGDTASNSYGDDPLNTLRELDQRPGYVDNMILWVVIWMTASGVSWIVNQFMMTDMDFNYWESPAYHAWQLLATYGWCFIGLGLAAVIPDKTKRVALLVMASLLAVWRIYNAVDSFFSTL